MDRICDYCKCQFDDSLDKCPHCGAPNDYVQRRIGIPKTIEELKIWCDKKNIDPAAQTKCFIGENVDYTDSYGVYKDQATGDYIVYKNKHNGERSVKYRGKDESYAVNETYLNLKQLLLDKRLLNEGNEIKSLKRKYLGKQIHPIVAVIIFLFVIGFIFQIIFAIFAFFWSQKKEREFNEYFYNEYFNESNSEADGKQNKDYNEHTGTGTDDVTTEQYGIGNDSDKREMDPVKIIANILGCSERTAQGVNETLSSVSTGSIVHLDKVDVDTDNFTTIRYELDTGEVFYAKIGKGYLVRKILKDSDEGEIVYEAIE